MLVSKGQVTSGGLFRKSVLKVKITTTPTNWKVERSLEDFKWLHNALKSRFPMNYIMEFPTITPSEDQLVSDEYYLTGYMMHIAQSPELLFSQELEDFLKLEGPKFAQLAAVSLFVNQKPVVPLFKKPKDLLDFNQNIPICRFSTPSGVVEMDLNPGIKKLSKELSKLSSSMSENTDTAKDLCAEIGRHLDKAGELSQRLAKHLSKICKTYAEFLESHKLESANDIVEMFDMACKSIDNSGIQWRKTASVISKDMDNMFTLGVDEVEGFQALVEQRNTFAETYEEAKINLERKKVALFDQKDLRRWGVDPKKVKIPEEKVFKDFSIAQKLMLPQETQAVRNLRDFLGCFNKKVVCEMDVFTLTMLNRMNEFFQKFVSLNFDQFETQARYLGLFKQKLELSSRACTSLAYDIKLSRGLSTPAAA